MTFKEMTDTVVHLLGVSTRPANDETVFVKRHLNNGVVDLLSRCRPSTQVMQLGLQPNVIVHTLDPVVIAIKDLFHPVFGFLPRRSRMDAVDAQSVGEPCFAYTEPLLWISPIPSAAIYVQAHGTFRPTAMSADTDDPSARLLGGIASEFHGAILNYALWKTADLIQHAESSFGERWRLLYEGQDGLTGDVSRIKRIVEKRATPQGSRRRDLTGSLGSLSDSGSYSTTRG